MTQAELLFSDPLPNDLHKLIVSARSSETLSACGRAILDVLTDPCRLRVGKQSAISIARLQELWMQLWGEHWCDRDIKKAVKELVEEHRIPVGSSRVEPYGYYLAVSDEDIEAAERPLRREIQSLAARLKTFNPKSDYVRHILGQQELE
jgi:hypothetical protein